MQYAQKPRATSNWTFSVISSLSAVLPTHSLAHSQTSSPLKTSAGRKRRWSIATSPTGLARAATAAGCCTAAGAALAPLSPYHKKPLPVPLFPEALPLSSNLAPPPPPPPPGMLHHSPLPHHHPLFLPMPTLRSPHLPVPYVLRATCPDLVPVAGGARNRHRNPVSPSAAVLVRRRRRPISSARQSPLGSTPPWWMLPRARGLCSLTPSKGQGGGGGGREADVSISGPTAAAQACYRFSVCLSLSHANTHGTYLTCNGLTDFFVRY